MNREVLENANVLWNYFSSFNEEIESDVIVVCCSYDLRVCDYACKLFRKNGAKIIIFSGDKGNWTSHLWEKAEAEIFRDRAMINGIEDSKIIVEDKATNLGENIQFSKKFFKDNDKITLVSKSNTLLRIKLTFPIHLNFAVSVSGPLFNFPDEVSNSVGVLGLINEMVGDIERIIRYPDLGYQIKHDIPLKVLASYYFLIQRGFVDHLLKGVYRSQ